MKIVRVERSESGENRMKRYYETHSMMFRKEGASVFLNTSAGTPIVQVQKGPNFLFKLVFSFASASNWRLD